jgi:hypothetical protein
MTGNNIVATSNDDLMHKPTHAHASRKALQQILVSGHEARAMKWRPDPMPRPYTGAPSERRAIAYFQVRLCR